MIPDDAMEFGALVYRVGGVWKVAVRLPSWLYTDIKESEQSVTVLLPNCQTVGYSSYQGTASDFLMANAKFEYVNPKEDKE